MNLFLRFTFFHEFIVGMYYVTLILILIYIQQRIMVQGFEMNILLCKPKYVSNCVLLHSPFIHWKKKGKNYVTFVVFSLMNESGMYSERLFPNVSQIILFS